MECPTQNNPHQLDTHAVSENRLSRMERRKVWIPHPKECFILGELMDFDGSGKATILPADPAYGMQACNLNDVLYAEEYEKDVDDNCSLLHFNPATLLNNIRKRYKKNKIYACREEMMLRMKTFHSWKEKQQKSKYSSPGTILKKQDTHLNNYLRLTSVQNRTLNIDNPSTKIMPVVLKPPHINVTTSKGSQIHLTDMKDCESKSQRYFRIPFIQPSKVNSLLSTRGWWYAHFDGQYVVRQLEVLPDRPARLLRSGKDDFEICPLSLEETGLTRRRGAEILEEEFEKEWKRLGGT